MPHAKSESHIQQLEMLGVGAKTPDKVESALKRVRLIFVQLIKF